ncbi:MAG: hypothetical protein R3331_12130 [Sulfurospirillaceae bacterium]|nr:hypothetical protein [Sulfurospirillaceae bacterium]
MQDLNVNFQIFKNSFIELFYSLMISTLPLWGLYFFLSSKTSDIFSLDRFFLLVHNGELFIYAATTLAPIFYLAIKDREENKRFYFKHFFIWVTLIITIFETIIIISQRTNNMTINQPWINVSIGFYITSVVIMYFALVIHNSLMPDPSNTMRNSENDFLEQVNKHR